MAEGKWQTPPSAIRHPSLNHGPGIQQLIKLLTAHESLSKDDVIHPSATFQRFFRHLGRLRITERWNQRGDDSDRLFDETPQLIRIGSDAHHTSRAKNDAGVAQLVNASQQPICDDRLERVQLKLPRFSC